MSTRATVHFTYNGKTEAIVYRHYDGDTLAEDIDSKFFPAVEADTKDTRYDDPTYLAAKFIVWQAAQYARTYDVINRRTREYGWKDAPRLAFTGVAPMLEDPGDIEYRVTVNCSLHGNPNGRPVITQEKV